MTSEFRVAQKRVLERFEVKANSTFVDVPAVNGRAHALVAGSGPPLVMLNGAGTPAAMWAPLMAELQDRKLYAVDLPGFGLTDTTPKLTDDYRRLAVRFLDEVLGALALESAAFVGNSLGSLWALWFALDRPRRVTSLAHIGCPAVVLGTSAPAPMRLMSVPHLANVLTRLDPPSLKQVTRLSKMVRQFPLEPEIATLLLETEQLPGCQEAFHPTLRTLLRLRGPRTDMALGADDLSGVTQPSLLIWGHDDPFGTVTQGRNIAAAHPHCDFHVVDGGHAPWLNNAEEISRLMTSSAALAKSSPRE